MTNIYSSKPILAVVVAILYSLVNPLLLRSQEPGDVVRVSTDLVQTDVLVLDKNGEFVDGLKPEQFQVRVNGRPRTLSSFDRVVAGTATEEERMAAARGIATTGASARPDRGRTILFYLDDYHMSSNSVIRVRDFLTKFAERQMEPDDQVALITSTGQLGFLEQFISDSAILTRAINKFAHRSFSTRDAERTPMTESEAASINSNDRRIIDYFVEQWLKEMGRRTRPVAPGGMPRVRTDAENAVRARATSIIDQSTALSVATLNGLERLIRLTSVMPWRKTLFFISDGFMIHDHSHTGLDLKRVAKAAAQATTVIYSIDANGLITDLPDASRKTSFSYGQIAGSNSNAIGASQQPLRDLAIDSAGKAILNTNSPTKDLNLALKEMANYYLLTWRPDEKDISNGFQSLEVSVSGRSDLVVRVRHGYSVSTSVAEKTAPKKESSKKNKSEPEKPLPAALRSLAPRLDLPVSLSLGYVDIGMKTATITTTLEVPLDVLRPLIGDRSESIELDILGAGIDESGRTVATFDQSLTVKASEVKAAKSERVIYNHQLNLSPGLYQVRVAVQERTTNRIGTALQWIDVPDLTAGKFSLSSLFVGEIDNASRETGKLSVNASRRFRSGSTLGFFFNIYNASRVAEGADLALQIQIFRDQQPVITKSLIKIDGRQAADPARIPYGEDFSLRELPAGKYILSITVIDRISKNSAQQRTSFAVF